MVNQKLLANPIVWVISLTVDGGHKQTAWNMIPEFYYAGGKNKILKKFFHT